MNKNGTMKPVEISKKEGRVIKGENGRSKSN
jgi:hypothetical protein